MPSGKNLPVHTDKNPPRGDDPIKQAPYLWNHPVHGPLEVDPRGGMTTVSQEYFDANAFSDPVPTAGEQVDALQVGDAPPAVAGDLGGGVTVSEVRTAVPTSESWAEKAEREKRMGAANAVAAAANQSRSFNAGALGGVGIGARGGMNIAARELMKAAAEQGKPLTEEEALALIRAEEEASAGGQADALEGAVPPE